MEQEQVTKKPRRTVRARVEEMGEWHVKALEAMPSGFEKELREEFAADDERHAAYIALEDAKQVVLDAEARVQNAETRSKAADGALLRLGALAKSIATANGATDLD